MYFLYRMAWYRKYGDTTTNAISVSRLYAQYMAASYCRMKCLSGGTNDACEGRNQRLRPDWQEHHARRAWRHEHRFRGRERLDQCGDARAPAEVRLGAGQPACERLGHERRHLGRWRSIQGAVDARSGTASLERSRR